MAFPRWGGVLPPIPPRAPNAPPTVGGSHRNFHFGKFWKCSPHFQKLHPIWTILEQSPPHCGGGAPQNQRFAPPPLWGGAPPNSRKASKTRDVMAPPQALKTPSRMVKTPPHLVCSFCHFCSPPRVLGWGGESPPFSMLPPTVGGTGDPYTKKNLNKTLV